MQIHVFISGFVQGVGFRQFVKVHAKELILTGWVRNNPDNTVEIVLQGERDQLEQMIALCHKGPFLADVKDIKVIWEECPEKFSSFEVIQV